MTEIRFEYRMEIQYSQAVEKSWFTLKCIPAEDFIPFQQEDSDL